MRKTTAGMHTNDRPSAKNINSQHKQSNTRKSRPKSWKLHRTPEQQYEYLAIKLGLMARNPVAASNKQDGKGKENKRHVNSIKSGSMKTIRTAAPQQSQQKEPDYSNPYSELLQRISYQGLLNSGQQQIDNLYAKYQNQQNASNTGSLPQTNKPILANNSLLRTEHTIAQQQVALNRLMAKFCKL